MSLVVEMKPQLWQTPVKGPWSQGPRRWAPPTSPTASIPTLLTGQRVCVHLEVPLTVGLGGEGRQADETHKGALSLNTGLVREPHWPKTPKLCLPGPWGPWEASRSGKENHPGTHVTGMQPQDRHGEPGWEDLAFGGGVLTTMATHVDLQGTGAWAAFAALGEGADPLIGVGLLGLLFRGGHGRGASTLAAGTVVEEVGLQVPLATVPDATVFAGKDVF